MINPPLRRYDRTLKEKNPKGLDGLQLVFPVFFHKCLQHLKINTAFLEKLMHIRSALRIEIDPEEFLGVLSGEDPLDIRLLNRLSLSLILPEHDLFLNVQHLHAQSDIIEFF